MTRTIGRTRFFVALSGAACVALVVAGPAYALPIVHGTKIGFDMKNTANTTQVHAFAGLLLPGNSTWNLTQSDVAAGTVKDANNTTVDGVATARFGSTWSNWGSIPFAPETNLVTQDYIFDNNGIGVNGYDALWQITGLSTDPLVRYSLAIHANRIQNVSGGVTDGATVVIGTGAPVPTVLGTQALPQINSGAAALWPDGGFQTGLTSALFTGLTAPGGTIDVYFNKGALGNVIFTGAELQANFIPEPSTLVLGLLGCSMLGLLAWRRSGNAGR